VTTVQVVCDDPSHARGKIATVAVFDRDERGVWADRRAKTRTRSFYSRADSPSEFRCRLCRRELPLWALERRVLFAALDHIAAQGVLRTTIGRLALVASKLAG
jgi:hypothetical protein